MLMCPVLCLLEGDRRCLSDLNQGDLILILLVHVFRLFSGHTREGLGQQPPENSTELARPLPSREQADFPRRRVA